MGFLCFFSRFAVGLWVLWKWGCGTRCEVVAWLPGLLSRWGLICDLFFIINY